MDYQCFTFQLSKLFERQKSLDYHYTQDLTHSYTLYLSIIYTKHSSVDFLIQNTSICIVHICKNKDVKRSQFIQKSRKKWIKYNNNNENKVDYQIKTTLICTA